MYRATLDPKPSKACIERSYGNYDPIGDYVIDKCSYLRSPTQQLVGQESVQPHSTYIAVSGKVGRAGELSPKGWNNVARKEIDQVILRSKSILGSFQKVQETL